ncbi:MULTISPECIES: type IV secretion system protein VirB3 [Rhizobium/Agrobacterium group]|jgi:type IV secretion system protein VirB3|uniref:Type IV secretion system protein VirB3 n=2 Tax=Rhizobium/Agrobacterium group TaxID=227290 RepID=A0A1B9UPA2_AGRTU|nr:MULTISPECIES: type IV secretion system protein VirB3 [Rhizobium/Agrobacterium group]MDP9563754.1 type IV secretion system protein VirB3 [Rhizobium nepotum]QDG94072.1 type IV secretion system protein VirB3 [Rhizobium sp. NIBRBAC000502774]HCV73969.1 type IV secretion system protein VirB3 [Agrobacterium sp.]ADY68094.1 type IV secretion protein AvhB3 [Agrobacterium tumefaciens]KAA3498496.1 type IV secretion system protein VirB3 [Agrobacterium tumefaciens]
MVGGQTVLEEDTLFIACTRPAMIAGVTMEAMGFNIMVTTILYIVAGSIAYAFVGIVFHLIFKALVKHDHNMFRILLAWVETRGRSRNGAYWGGATLSPLRLTRRFDERDIGIA